MVEAVVFSLRQQVREKRLTPDLWLLRESIANQEISTMEHVQGEYMVADGMTKYSIKGAAAICQAMGGAITLNPDPPSQSHPNGKRRQKRFTSKTYKGREN